MSQFSNSVLSELQTALGRQVVTLAVGIRYLSFRPPLSLYQDREANHRHHHKDKQVLMEVRMQVLQT